MSSSLLILNASSMLVFSSISLKIDWFGRQITASALAFNSWSPCCAWRCRRAPSKSKGNVTIPSTNAPDSRAIRARTGAPPVPVPPPNPARTKMMSAPAQSSLSLSASTSAAFLPISGSPPVPRPRVKLAPSTRLSSTDVRASAWASVFSAMNGTPSRPSLRRCAMALQPPPPIPMTLMVIFFSKSLIAALVVEDDFMRWMSA